MNSKPNAYTAVSHQTVREQHACCFFCSRNQKLTKREKERERDNESVAPGKACSISMGHGDSDGESESSISPSTVFLTCACTTCSTRGLPSLSIHAFSIFAPLSLLFTCVERETLSRAAFYHAHYSCPLRRLPLATRIIQRIARCSMHFVYFHYYYYLHSLYYVIRLAGNALLYLYSSQTSAWTTHCTCIAAAAAVCARMAHRRQIAREEIF